MRGAAERGAEDLLASALDCADFGDWDLGEMDLGDLGLGIVHSCWKQGTDDAAAAYFNLTSLPSKGVSCLGVQKRRTTPVEALPFFETS